MSCFRLRVMIFGLAGLGGMTGACDRPGYGDSNSPPPVSQPAPPVVTTAPTSQSVTDPHLRRIIGEFYATIEKERRQSGDGLLARAYIDGLPTRDQTDLARVVARDARINVAFLSIAVLSRHGLEAETVPVLERMVLEGHDLSPVYYYWIHHDDERLGGRTLLLLLKRLMARMETYSKIERKRARAVLVEPPQKYSEAAAQRRIADLESRLAAPKTEPRP